MSVNVQGMTGEQLLVLTVLGRPMARVEVQRELRRRSLFGRSDLRPPHRSSSTQAPAERRSASLVA